MPLLSHTPWFKSRRVLGVPALAAAILAGPGACGPVAHAEAELTSGARVRFQAPDYARGWMVGMVGEAGHCTTVMVPDSWDVPRRFDVIPVDSITRLQVSARGEASAAAAANIDADRWKEVSIEPLHARYGGCSPMEIPDGRS